ncbi:MAG: DNA gyrase inhibitor YacG [Kordiimonadales bacterium]|nr:MAG: DNA gyrase inhibitor YacG [Kordiimonadales bacterium]
MSTTKCPQCSKETEHAFRPFCSKRCADLDLGKWFNEEYHLPGDSPALGDPEEQ